MRRERWARSRERSRPFIGFIMSWGPWVEVISPKSLRNEVAGEARAICKIYG
ncbi:MAG: WYL domain-containing protein [Dehalococcoidia bacterium]